MPADDPTKYSFRIAALYAFAAAAWILFSDRLAVWIFPDPTNLAFVNSVKGLLFVAVTATLLFVVARRQMRRSAATQSAHLRAEKAGRVSEERFRALASLSPDIISIFDRDGRLVFNSSAAARIHGYKEGDLVGRSTFELIHPEDLQSVQSILATVLEGPGVPAVVRYRYRNADGSYTWMEASARNELGNPHIQGIIAISRDISDRVRGDQLMRESEARLKRAEEVAGLGHWTLYLSTQEAFGSEGAQRIAGVTSPRLTLEEIRSKILPEYHESLDAALRGLMERGEPFDAEYKLRRASDGKSVDIHVLGERDLEAGIVFGTIQDITARKQAEAKMRLENAALAAAANAIAITDREGRLVWVNPAFTTLTGYAEAEAYGRKVGELLGSGKHDREFFAEMWKTVLNDRPWHGELTNRRKDGSLYREEQTITPVHDERNAITHFIAIKQDVTARKALESQVYRSQRLDSIGCLAGGIAHDLNNILSPILLAPAVLRDSINDPKALATLEAVETSAKRGASVIRQLLTFSRGSDAYGEYVLVQWRHIVREMMNIMRETFPKNITVVPRFIGDIWLVPANATQLHQVLMNLCVNARDAMPGGGTITIGLENVELDASATAGSPKASPGPHVMLSVTDTGTGILQEHLDKVFDPFFTTKDVGKGTGLGLSSVLGIVRAHRGVIQVNSKQGEGTQFRIYLPAAVGDGEPVSATVVPTKAKSGGECILLVDDEASVRTVAARILETQGYRVLLAKNGAEGLEAFREHGRQIALVITDIMMPVMDGQTLIRQLLEIDSGTKIIAMSGYAGTEPSPGDWMRSASAVLLKPFEGDDLSATVLKVLQSKKG
jgi:PAS domain S-box-containing protein